MAEITRNWPGGGLIISKDFENFIAVNLARGYVLHSWDLSVTPYRSGEEEGITETIIAVFKRKDLP